MAGYGIRDASTLVTAIGDYARYTENKRRYDQEYQDKKAREAKLDDRWERDYDMRRESHELGVKQSELNISELEKQIQDRADSKKLRQQRIDTLNATQQEATQVNTEPRQQITQALGLGNSGTGQGPMGFIDNGDGTQTPYITTQKGEAKPLNSVANDDKSPTIKGTPEAFDKLASNVEQAGIVRPDDSPEDAQAVVRNATEMDADGYITGNLNSPEAFAENIKQWGPKAQAPSELQPVESLQAKSLALDERIEYFRSKRDAEGQDGMSRDIYGQQYEDLLKEKAAIDKKVAINIDKNRQQPQAPLKTEFPQAKKNSIFREVGYDVGRDMDKAVAGVGKAVDKYVKPGGGIALAKDVTDAAQWWFGAAGPEKGAEPVPPAVEKTVSVDGTGKPGDFQIKSGAKPQDVQDTRDAVAGLGITNSNSQANLSITSTTEMPDEYNKRVLGTKTQRALQAIDDEMYVKGFYTEQQWRNKRETGYLEYNAVQLQNELYGIELTKSRIAKNARDAAIFPAQLREAKAKGKAAEEKFYNDSLTGMAGEVAGLLGKDSNDRTAIKQILKSGAEIGWKSLGIDTSKLGDLGYRIAIKRAMNDWYRSDGHTKGDSFTGYLVTDFGRYRPQVTGLVDTMSMGLQEYGVTTVEVTKFVNDRLALLREKHPNGVPDSEMEKAIPALKADLMDEYMPKAQ